MEFYVRAENPRGELGFYFRTTGKSDIPSRVKCRSGCFSNLSILPEISKGMMLTDMIATMGSLDFMLGEIDR